jgi:hypothetical protein
MLQRDISACLLFNSKADFGGRYHDDSGWVDANTVWDFEIGTVEWLPDSSVGKRRSRAESANV